MKGVGCELVDQQNGSVRPATYFVDKQLQKLPRRTHGTLARSPRSLCARPAAKHCGQKLLRCWTRSARTAWWSSRSAAALCTCSNPRRRVPRHSLSACECCTYTASRRVSLDIQPSLTRQCEYVCGSYPRAGIS